MFKFLDFLFPGKAKLQKELKAAHDELNPLTEHLVGWEGEELELMSLIQDQRVKSRGFKDEVKGIICSIYHEHMIAYLFRKIAVFGEMQLMVAQTKKYFYEYVIRNGRISFYVNNQFLGEYRKDNRLYLTKSRVLAEIDISGAHWWSVKVEGQDIGSVVNIEKAREVNPRAFQLRRNLPDEMEMIFLSIAIFEIVNRTKELKKIPFR